MLGALTRGYIHGYIHTHIHVLGIRMEHVQMSIGWYGTGYNGVQVVLLVINIFMTHISVFSYEFEKSRALVALGPLSQPRVKYIKISNKNVYR